MSDTVLQNILDLIKQRNITEKECLRRCEINTSFLTDWKNGKIKFPSYDKIIRLADALDVSVERILFGVDDTSSYRDQKERELIEGFRELNDCEKNIIIGKIYEFIYVRNKREDR